MINQDPTKKIQANWTDFSLMNYIQSRRKRVILSSVLCNRDSNLSRLYCCLYVDKVVSRTIQCQSCQECKIPSFLSTFQLIALWKGEGWNEYEIEMGSIALWEWACPRGYCTTILWWPRDFKIRSYGGRRSISCKEMRFSRDRAMKRNSFLNDDPLSWILILWETHLTANLPLLSVITMTQLFTPYLGTLIPSRTIRKRSGNMHDYVRLQHITFLNLTAHETP